jgi:oxalate decarboxylase/phosphoglucose isomerase-like protein (cupin superfamily)
MSIKNQIEISPLTCMYPSKGLEICSLNPAIKQGNTKVTEHLFGQESLLVTIEPGTIEELFVHHYQTDQLLVVEGSVVLVVLQNRSYKYIVMSDCEFVVIIIPPGIPHGVINPTTKPCIMLNGVLRHGPAHERDYRPLKRPFPYDLETVKTLLKEFHCTASKAKI